MNSQTSEPMNKTPGMPLMGQRIHYKTQEGRIVKGIVIRSFDTAPLAKVLIKTDEGGKFEAALKNNKPLTKRVLD